MSDRIVPQDFYVYVHRKATTGQVFYVGKGTGKRAWSTHRSEYWHNISKKHGFCVEIVESGLQEWYSFELECQLIALYGRDVLCNMTDGGEGVAGRLNNEATRQKMSNSRKGRKLSEAHKLALSIARTGKPTSEKHRIATGLSKKGKPLTEAHRLKLRIAMAKPETKERHRKATIESCGKPVICIETGQLFETAYCAEKWLRQTHKKALSVAVRAACKGRAKSAYGYTWRYP